MLEDEMGPPGPPADGGSRRGPFTRSTTEAYELPLDELDELTGDYHSGELSVTYRVRSRHGALRIDEPEPLDSHLVPAEKDTYQLGEVVLRFERLPDRIEAEDRAGLALRSDGV